VHNDAVVGFVNEVRAAADVIQVWWISYAVNKNHHECGVLAGLALRSLPPKLGAERTLPVPHLPRVRYKPDMHIMMLCESLQHCQHLADILCLVHVCRSLMVQLIVGINDQSTNPVSVHQVTT